MPRPRMLWTVWFAAVLPAGGVLLALMIFGGNRSFLLIGRTTDGHHQIELACDACHTSPFGGIAALQRACEKCHAAELTLANDSHPATKFRNPRNADRVAKLEARFCVTCHREHSPGITNAMAVTMPTDYCHICHEDIGEDRPTHRNVAFDSCASAGCHNFHDNRALYEDFLEKHRSEPDMKDVPEVVLKAATPKRGPARRPLRDRDADAPAAHAGDRAILADWAGTRHAAAGVNCSGCHGGKPGTAVLTWVARPDRKACGGCHERQAATFVEGKHGMRLRGDLFIERDGLGGLFKAGGFTAMRPELARAAMRADNHGRELNCSTCHDGHRFDTARAQVEACLGCHDDGHSKAYLVSSHYKLWQNERAGAATPGSGVTCTTCHMPRLIHKDPDGFEHVFVTHNQNDTLRPNEKMARPACLNCHGLPFTLDALADRELVDRNFSGRPSRHVDSIDWVVQRMKQRRALK